MMSATPRHDREIKDYDKGDRTGPNFLDHFSLREPSSTVKFRGSRFHVYDTVDEQILLEDRLSSKPIFDSFNTDGAGDAEPIFRHNVSVKRMPWTSFGMLILRTLYTLISTLLFGWAFAFSFQTVLFVFVKLADDVYDFNERKEGGVFFRVLSTLLSAPIFLFGFSSLMAMMTTFVGEAWTGGYLFRAVCGFPNVVKEAMYCVLLILTPSIALIYGLFARMEDPWYFTCLVWIISVVSMFVIFAIAIVWVEVTTCFKLIQIHYSQDLFEGEASSLKKIFTQVGRAILIVQRQVLSGLKHEQYVVTGDSVAPEGGFTFSEKDKPAEIKKSLYTYVTELKFLRFMFDTVDPPKRLYSVDEVREIMPFVTSHSWNLEMMFCVGNRTNKIITAKGPSALSTSQIISSFFCNLLGTVVIILIFVGILFWMSTGFQSYLLVGGFCIFFCLVPMMKGNIAMLQMYRDITRNDEAVNESLGDDADEENTEKEQEKIHEATEEQIFYKIWETSKVSQPKAWVCYTWVASQIILFFIIPFISFLRTPNYPIAVIFFIIALSTGIRRFCNASLIISELGPLSQIQIEHNPGSATNRKVFNRQNSYTGVEKTLVKKSRLGDIIGNISKSNSVTAWMWFFGFLVFFAFFLFYMAVQSDDGMGERPPLMLIEDYAYFPEESLQYPSCSITKGFQFSEDTYNGTNRNTLMDFSFMSFMAYETTSVTSYLLPQYFGEGVAVDEDELVKDYRARTDKNEIPIKFKFFTFPSNPALGVVAIRGSKTMMDWLNNLKLWSGAGLAQMVKWATPYGWLWTPILSDLVYFMGLVQAEELRDVDYYKVTTDFLEEYKEKYDALRVTGASLGGGLAIISGAQAKTPAVAISGLGAELNRDVVKPPVTMDDINKYVFNYIPDRDVIARVGGRPRQHQEAQCTAPTNSLLGCHSMFRNFCEISYRCGSNGRPVLCDCVFKYDYPLPEPIGNATRTFEEACRQQEQAFLDATGSSIRASWW